MISMLHLGISYGCNMNCNHCFVNKSMDRLSFEKIKEFIDILSSKGLLIVFFTFGEPLLSPLFEKVSNYLKKRGIVQIVMTNGSIMNEKLVKIIKNNVSKVFISLDSVNSQKHDTNRNFKNSFCKALKTIDIMSQNSINLGLAVTLNDKNIDEMSKFIDLAQSKKINTISFLRERKNGMNAELKKYNKYLGFYLKFISAIDNNEMNILFHDPSLIKPTKELFDKKIISKDTFDKYLKMNSCSIENTISLAPNGDVLSCNLANKKIGNICDESIYSILERRISSNECFVCCSKFPG